MHYTPDYSIKLPDGEVHLLFNTGMFINYCEFKGIDYEDLIEQVRTGKAFKVTNLPDLLRIAGDSYNATNNLQHSPYSKQLACYWIDSMGGLNALPLIDIYKMFVSRLLGVSLSEFEAMLAKEDQPEGKKQTEPA